MDQTCVGGLGNIYVNEILFKSKVNPKSDGKLSDLEVVGLLKIQKNSQKLDKFGGSSIKNFLVVMEKGCLSTKLLCIWEKKGEGISLDCNEYIIRTTISNRATFFCKGCKNNKVDPYYASIYTI